MSGRFVRASKYRHVFGRPTRKEQCYDNIRISKNAWDSNLLKANGEYLSVNWDAAGGGAFAVIPLEERGRLPEQMPLFRGHTAVVLDTDWSPFNDSLIASGSDDGKAFIWKVPEGFTLHQAEGEETQDVSPVAKLTGHSRKIGHVLFNPAAENILATSSGDFTIKLWDIESGSSRLTLKHTDIVQSLSWSANGALMVTTSRDKKLRIWDARQEQPVHVGNGHAGAKNSRAVWMGELDRVATTGFSKMSDRQLGLWDIRNADSPLGGFDQLDSLSGVCMPFWDDSTHCLYLAGKGDGNIRYYEYENDRFEYLSEYKSGDPQRGIAFLPKRAVNIHENEVMRAFKTVNDNYIEPISFIVPRRAEVFQTDIYPPVTGLKPGLSSAEWFDGKDGLPPKIDLESVYDGQAPKEVPSDYKPPPPMTPMTPSEPRKQTAVRDTPLPTPSIRSPPPTMKEQGASMSNLASKFADKEENSSEDETSSFEEVPKPVDRVPAAAAAAAAATQSEPKRLASPTKQSPSPPEGAQSPVKIPAAFQAQPSSPTAPTATTTNAPRSANAGASVDLQNEMAEIKSLLKEQSITMRAQSEMILQLTTEVEALRRAATPQEGSEA